jgi:type II secretory pathway pseudopilin PulG
MTQRQTRSAFTILETVVVAAILLIMAALSYPSLRSMQAASKMNAAIDSMRSSWAKARARAIQEGRPYRVAIEPDGSSYRIAPDQPDYWSGSPPADDPLGKGMVIADSLPDGVRFALNAAPALPGENEKSTPSGDLAPSSYSTAVVFLPDGTAREDVEICFVIRGAAPKTLQLRGLTGASTVRR